MTRDLVNRIKPNIIYREAMENLEGNSLKRYETITKILVDELGYKLVHQGKNNYGNESWKFLKNDIEHNLNEETIEEFYLHDMESRLHRYNKFSNEHIKIKIK